MREVLTVLRRIFMYYPLNYSAVSLIRIGGFAGLGILPGLLIQRYFDQVSDHTLTSNGLYIITALLIAVPLVQAATYYIDLSLSYGWTEIIRSYYRRNIFRELLKRPGAAPLPVHHGKLMNVIRSDTANPESLMWDIPYFLAYAIFSCCGLIILASIDWAVTVVLFTPLLLAIVVTNWFNKRITVYYEEQQKSSDKVTGLMSDIFNYWQAIKINHAGHSFLQRLTRFNDERASASRRNDVFKTALDSVYDNIVSIGTALLLLLISRKIRDGQFTLGDLTLFVYFLGYVSNLTRLIGRTWAGFRNMAVSLARIHEVIGDNHIHKLTNNDTLYLKEEPPRYDEGSIRRERLERIEVCELGFIYQASKQGIHDITFSLPRGSFTVITGKVGSGKTTLLRVILGLLPKSSGAVYWNGSCTDAESDWLKPPNTAYTPQVPHLFNETIRENIKLGQQASEQQLLHAAYLSVLDDDLPFFEEGFDTVMGTKGSKLSGGQQQRVAASRMFIRNAELLVMDDVASALDMNTEQRMWERLHRERQTSGSTCLVVTHNEYVMQAADQIIVLDNGRIKMRGTYRELIDSEGSETVRSLLS
ncbi:ABC transporter ATP-binding protein [Paenibacillus spongiae]|uniref:ABC transporter ATP-binding protein/permease n=1 Tax=Paenibacillus spongiae TaxID=2909671 RepID=A0ABY5SKV7_9BACL|nr:ABC transporter ATP-binding protein [Paenibacillus spongiae]UVI32878.1 ABC transporter ATP-binding protein/permease [Paenibacillus spongiae]